MLAAEIARAAAQTPAAKAQTPPPKGQASASKTPAPAPSANPQKKDQQSAAMLSTVGEEWKGDLDGMIKRRRIRILVPYSKTSYFIDKGIQRGVAYDIFKSFEDSVNLKHKTGNLRVHVVFIPTSRDQLANALLGGKGDIVAGNITITEERKQLADFTEPMADTVKEIIV